MKFEKFKMEIITVHPLSNHPAAAWEQLCQTIHCQSIQLPLDSDNQDDKVRIVCMSDTHATTSNLDFSIPDGDILVHAGDFTISGEMKDVVGFSNWLEKLPHKYKIVVAGNHELTFDKTFKRVRVKPKSKASAANTRKQLKNCIYLEDESVTVHGIKFYGSPWQPAYHNWAFNLPRGQPCLDKWNMIPSDTDVLITHGPPIGFGDLCYSGARAGCVELLTTIRERVKPKYHVFGHIHEGYGAYSDGEITYVNASTCDYYYSPVNPPITFDIPLPPGVTKSS